MLSPMRLKGCVPLFQDKIGRCLETEDSMLPLVLCQTIIVGFFLLIARNVRCTSKYMVCCLVWKNKLKAKCYTQPILDEWEGLELEGCSCCQRSRSRSWLCPLKKGSYQGSIGT